MESGVKRMWFVLRADDEESSGGSVNDEKRRSWKNIRIVRTVWMAAILITGLVLLIQFSKTRHVKLVIGNVVFRSVGIQPSIHLDERAIGECIRCAIVGGGVEYAA
jgi:hypothetical protein